MRLIIDYDPDLLTPGEALRRVAHVVDSGRVSETSKGVLHYCWCTTWSDVAVFTRTKKKNQQSDSFRVERR